MSKEIRNAVMVALGIGTVCVLVSAMTGCGKETTSTHLPANGPNCTVTKTDTGSVISCVDGTSFTVTNGTNGTNGSNGLNGTDGAAGATGATGPKGDTGETGAQGENGQNGYSLVSTVTQPPAGACGTNPDGSDVGGSVLLIAQDVSGTGQWCPNDPNQSSILICNGAVGQTGQTGDKGDQGDKGDKGDATKLDMVKFCSSAYTTYPSSFAEYGMCIDNKLYGVFWDRTNSWLAEIVPGYYKSTSTSASCNFKVEGNCKVTQE